MSYHSMMISEIVNQLYRMNPNGTILIIGGAEDRSNNGSGENRQDNHQYEKFEMLKELLPKNGKKGLKK